MRGTADNIEDQNLRDFQAHGRGRFSGRGAAHLRADRSPVRHAPTVDFAVGKSPVIVFDGIDGYKIALDNLPTWGRCTFRTPLAARSWPSTR